MKLLSVAVPCYNSQEYMSHCIETLLTGGPEMDIIIVDDGSTDWTHEMADEFQRSHPETVRAIHQKNAGHGGAVMTGLEHARGLYFKVVDSDDWVDPAALRRVLAALREFAAAEKPVDLLVCNYIYDKAGAAHKKVIRFASALPRDRVLCWDNVKRFHKGQYMLMHALIYRTALLRECGLELPKHTFYVDNLFAYTPLAAVQTLYYLDVDLYHYFIGREDQSVQEATMIRRIDQQIRVNKQMLEQVDLRTIQNDHQRQYMFNYLEIVTSVSTILLIRAGTKEHLQKKAELWTFIRNNYPWVYLRLRHGALGVGLNLPGKTGRRISVAGYKVSQRVFGFN